MGVVQQDRPAGRRRLIRAAWVLAAVVGLGLGSGAAAAGALPRRRAGAGPTPCFKCQKVPGNPAGSSGAGANAAAIAAREEPAIVDVSATLADGSGESDGTGMILTASGEILTNNHVIQGSNQISVKVSNGVQTFAAQLVGTDANDDVAVLQAQGAVGLSTISLGSSSQVAVGDGVVAIGNAFARVGPPTVTAGAVTALNQSITVQGDLGETEQLTGVIQTNANIEPGNSGGPLFNAAGQVIGMNTAAANGESPGADTNQSFSIPINHALSIRSAIVGGRGGGDVSVGQEGFLGVSVQTGTRHSSATTGGAGVLVTGVVPGSPAATVDIVGGDRITAINGQPLTSATRLSQLIAAQHPGAVLHVTWTDLAGQSHTATVQLTAPPSAP